MRARRARAAAAIVRNAPPEARTKALVASAIWLLIGDDRLDPSVRVAEIVPEFATNGKEAVTVRWLLCHKSGLVDVDRFEFVRD